MLRLTSCQVSIQHVPIECEIWNTLRNCRILLTQPHSNPEQIPPQNRAHQTPFKVHRGHPISGTNLARTTMEKRFAGFQYLADTFNLEASYPHHLVRCMIFHMRCNGVARMGLPRDLPTPPLLFFPFTHVNSLSHEKYGIALH